MIAFIMQSKLKHFGLRGLSLIFWLLVWEITARLVNIRYIIPSICDIATSFLNLAATTDFWISILMSLLRILLGFFSGVILAIMLASIAKISELALAIIRPMMTVIRSTPVASFIMVLWLLVGGGSIPILIAVLMVLPVVWQSTYDGLCSPNRDLNEMADVFRFSGIKRLKYIVIPSTLKYVLPSIVNASGLAWKAGIAAEIITYTSGSIGREIANAKNYLEGAQMFAWTIAVIILSLLIEIGIKTLSGKVSKLWE